MKPVTTIAFDIYGTIINTSGIYNLLKEIDKDKADSIVTMWRNKQLEYSFRQAAMKIYKGFSYCTETALRYSLKYHDLEISDSKKQQLLNAYKELPAFDDVHESLRILSLKKYNTFAFSNGEKQAIKQLLKVNNISNYFKDIISVENVKTFKPDPEVYAYFNTSTDTKAENTVLVSSNPFDIIGAANYGFKTIWLNRDSKGIFDPWEINPDYEISSLTEIQNLKLK